MIDLVKIEKNKNDFYGVINAYNICDVGLVDKLADIGLFDSPATSMLNLHNAFPGGLVDHLLRVASYSLKVNETLPENLRQPKVSVIRVSLLHGIGKVGLFKPCKSEWHIKNLGKMYEFNNDLVSMTVGERSVFYITNNGYGSILNDLEYQAIMNHDKSSDDKMAEYHTSTLGDILKIGIKLAIIEEKNK